MTERGPRRELAGKIAGDVVLSDDPGATIRKWRTDFDIAQTTLADHLDVSASVISDYESGRRASPGIGVVKRVVQGLLDIDERRGGDHLRQYARVLSAGFEGDIVRDLREYSTAIALDRFYDAIDATEVVSGTQNTVAGHTVINSIEAITRLSSEEFYRLYGQSTNRALIFTDITHGEGALVALRVVTQTPSAVVLHGLGVEDLWEHAPTLARADGFSLAVADGDLESMLEAISELP